MSIEHLDAIELLDKSSITEKNANSRCHEHSAC